LSQSNEIDSLGSKMDSLQRLRELRCSDNALQAIAPSLGRCTALEQLDVSFNQLTLIPPEIGGCKSMRVLKAQGNVLRTIPAELAKLESLEDLFLDKNPLIRIPATVATMALGQFTFDIANLQSPPLVIASKGTEYTMHYLRLLRTAETQGRLELTGYGLDAVPLEVCEVFCLPPKLQCIAQHARAVDELYLW
jgi:internalin A